MYLLPHFFLHVFVIALVSNASSSGVQRLVAPALGYVSVTGSASALSLSATGGGRSTEMSGEVVFPAASSVVVGRGSSRRRFFLAGISSACGLGGNGAAIVCGGGARYHGSERFAAFRRTVNVRFRFGPLLTVVSVEMEVSAGFCIRVTRICDTVT
jgi:hypothetical protein